MWHERCDNGAAVIFFFVLVDFGVGDGVGDDGGSVGGGNGKW